MKKTLDYFWPSWPDAIFQKLQVTKKIAFLLLICGMVLPAISLAAEKPKSSFGGPPAAVADPQQQINVSGTITDAATGQVMTGVNVQVKGKTIGAISDINGKFTLPSAVDQNAVLVFSFIGYVTQEVPVGGKIIVNVALTSEVLGLEEVVVVGYGTTKKVSLTGAIAAVSSKEIKTVSTTNLVTQLAGKLPGLRVTQRTGEPGVFSTVFDIRGFGSPLIVIDGVVMSQADFVRLNPNDIDQISVLKDASAAVYGVQAANGVVLVTTKRGATGKPRIDFATSYSVSKYVNLPRIMNAYQFASITTQAEINSGKAANATTYPEDILKQYQDGTLQGTDIYSEVTRKFQNAQKYNLSISGGTDRIKYFTSLGKTDEMGLWKSGDLNYHTYSIRSVVSAKITDNLEAELNLDAMIDTRKAPTSSVQGTFQSIFMHWLPVLHLYANDNPDYLSATVDGLHPLAMTTKSLSGYSNTNRNTFNGIFSLNYKMPFVKGLNARLMYRYYNLSTWVKTWRQGWKMYTYDAVNNVYNNTMSKNLPSTMTGNYTPQYKTSLSLQLNYDKVFLEKHNVKATLIYEDRFDNSDNFNGSKEFAINIDQFYAGLTNPLVSSSSGSIGSNDNQSIIGRVNYDFASKYLIELGFNYNGSSKFPSGKRWGFFPYTSVGWRLSEEDFFKNSLPFMTNFKLRGSWGIMGDDAASSFQFITGYNYPSGNYIFNGASISGLGFRSIPNPNITWFTANTKNIGFDASVKNGLINMSFDIFRRDRSGLLANPTAVIPGTVGASLSQQNLNSDMTQGLEAVLGHMKKIGKFGYDVSVNVTYTRTMNKYIERVADGNSFNAWRNNSSDRWVSQIWGYNYLGQFQNQDELNSSPIQDGQGNRTLKPGDYKYQDINKDGLVTSADNIPIGWGSIPNMTYGLSGSVTYGQFDLNFLFQGGSQFNMSYVGYYRGPLPWNRNSLNMFMDNWHHENIYDATSPWIPGKYAPAATNGTPPSNGWTSQFWLTDNTFLRFKSFELGYNLNKTLASKLKLENLRIYVNGFNIYSWCKQKEFDPEIQANDNYPLTRDFTFGLNITF